MELQTIIIIIVVITLIGVVTTFIKGIIKYGLILLVIAIAFGYVSLETVGEKSLGFYKDGKEYVQTLNDRGFEVSVNSRKLVFNLSDSIQSNMDFANKELTIKADLNKEGTLDEVLRLISMFVPESDIREEVSANIKLRDYQKEYENGSYVSIINNQLDIRLKTE